MLNKELRNMFLKEKDVFTDILGQDKVKEQMKSALLMDRNIIIVGAPGIGKTTLAKNIAKLLKKGRFVRIQGSPDLAVEDLLGDIDPIKAMKYGPLSVEAFTKGKIFKADKGILFFDELNRCPEKLQNALLQVLQEKRATIGSYDVDFDVDFIFIGSLPPKEKILIKEKEKIKLVKIGNLVDAQIIKNGSVIKNKSEITRNKDHLKALAYNPKRKKIEELEITSFIRHRPTDFIYEISLKKGRSVKVTGKHSVFTGSSEDLVPTEVGKLKIGDKIAIPKRINYKPLNLKKIDLIKFFADLNNKKTFFIKGWNIPQIVEKYKSYFRKKYNFHKIANFKYFKRLYISDINKKILAELKDVKIGVNGSKNYIKKDLIIDNDLCWLIGFFVAEGFTQKAKNNKGTFRYNLWVSNKDINFIEKIKEIIVDKFGVIPHIKKDKRTGVFDLTISSCPLFYVFERLFEILKGSKNKKVPNLIFQLNKEKIKYFLKGYIDGDGTYYKDKHGYNSISMSTVSYDLANELAYLFLRFGKILSIKKNVEKRKNHNDCYHLYVGNTNENNILNMKEDYDYLSFEEIISIKRIKTKPVYVYDLEVLNNKKTDNFIGGFGGVLLHNTMNPEDSSTERLSDVLLDRFDVIYMGYPETSEIEKEIVLINGKKEDVEFGAELLDLIVYFVRSLRESKDLEKKPSVRATLGLYERAQANALLSGRKKVSFEDIEKSVISVLAHRIKLRPNIKYLQSPEDFIDKEFKRILEHKDIFLKEKGGDG